MMQNTGKLLMFAGLIILVAGLVLWLGGDRLRWLGRLPGDISVEKPNFRFYFPVTTMIIVSIVLTLVLWLIRKFL
jgi:hypothetical protein